MKYSSTNSWNKLTRIDHFKKPVICHLWIIKQKYFWNRYRLVIRTRRRSDIKSSLILWDYLFYAVVLQGNLQFMWSIKSITLFAQNTSHLFPYWWKPSVISWNRCNRFFVTVGEIKLSLHCNIFFVSY